MGKCKKKTRTVCNIAPIFCTFAKKVFFMKKILDFTVVGKADFGRAAWLRLRADEPLPDIEPGQFAQVRVEDSPMT